MRLAAGDEVDRYEIVGLLGEGGMASVYLVRHRLLGSEHVLKVLSLSGKGLAERLMDEGRVQAALRHPNVVEVTDVVLTHGAPGLIMRYVRGPSLDALLDERRLTLDEVRLLVPRILAGVRAAHELGFVHRDLKPANVLLSVERGGVVPQVADFGLVKRTDGHNRTASGATMGTPQYLAPEQIRGADKADARADLFSMGAVCYELLCGRPPFDADNVYDILTQVSELDFVPLHERAPDVPEPMLAAVAAALQPLDQRVESVEAFWSLWDPTTSLDEAAAGPAPWSTDEIVSLAPARPSPSEVPSGTWSDAGAATSADATFADSLAPVAPSPTPVHPTLPAPRSRAPLVVAALVAIVVAATAGAGVAGLALFAGLSAGGSAPEELLTAPEPEPEPVTEPEPAPQPAPEPEPQPAPEPAPASQAEPTPKPEPKPAPVPDEGQATWAVALGDAGSTAVLIGADGREHPPGPISPGSYRLVLRVPGAPDAGFPLTVEPGAAVSATCVMRNCQITR